MKTIKYILSVIFILFGFNTFSQNVIDENGNPYTGEYVKKDAQGHIIYTVMLENGIKNGKTVFYYLDGTIQEIRYYKNDLRDGTWISYSKDGIKTTELNYKDGNKNGVWKIWNNDGVLLYEMAYANNNPVSTWKMYNTKGELVSTKSY